MEEPRYFLLVEISEEKQEVTVNGCPDALRMLANDLHQLAAEAEAQGKLNTQSYFSPDWGGLDLESRQLHIDMPRAKSFSFCSWPSANFARQFLHDGR